ncbi:hypothetical protein COU77_03420 [Candidatus Peregrinibacteria bacterium CG10_big_fil_rev_8_21_14_0_10_49_16]|nr:MAG: hypothetical protein COU77_03420 [Candidatus Peregrinibacteria bacterium CG10_big_fil_rev_8_21_14_0_10_49_16]
MRKMLLAASEDLRVIMIKLADRLHNVETLDALPAEKQQRVARETLDIYVPFARLMGLWWMKRCFEECCFPIAFGAQAEEWRKVVLQRRRELDGARRECIRTLHRVIRMPVDIELSSMTDYELFLKCGGDSRLLEHTAMFDSILIVPKDSDASPEVCYLVLGDVHGGFPVKSASFRDLIGQPLTNGYQGLHTTIFLSHNHQLRVRIQTKRMHEYAEMRKYSSWMQDKDNDLYRALNSLHQRYLSHDQYIQELKNDVLKEKISVFTPAGEIVTLPAGSTGIDLAFALNPDFFSRLTGVRVNGAEQEVTRPLHDGDTAELIMTAQNVPEEYRAIWRQRAATGNARGAMQEEAEALPEDQLMEEGRTVLTHECQKYRLPVWWMLHLQQVQQKLCEACESRDFPTLLRDVGTGLLPAQRVIKVYSDILSRPPSLFLHLLKVLNLLPTLRVLNPKATLVQLEVSSEDRPGMVHDITKCFADRGVNMSRFTAYAIPPKDALYKIWLEVDDFEEFSELYDALLQVPSVKAVLRVK